MLYGNPTLVVILGAYMKSDGMIGLDDSDDISISSGFDSTADGSASDASLGEETG